MIDYWRDAIMGVVIGDALGCPVEFEDRAARVKDPVTDMRGYGTFQMPAGTWTDDSSMTLALLDSIRQTNQLDLKHIMNCFMKWVYDGEYTPFGKAFDVGRGTSRAIAAFKHRGNPRQCGSYAESNNGNASLMRIMPACLYCFEKGLDDRAAIREIHAVGSLTHAHIRSNIACGLYYFMVKNALLERGTRKEYCLQKGISEGFAFYEKELADHENLEYYQRLRDLEQFAKTPESEIRSSGYVVDTLEAAVWCLLTTDSFTEALLKAVNLGDDTDTVGAVCGGLAGLLYPHFDAWGQLPAKWVKTIQRSQWIEELCREVNDRSELRMEETHPCIGFSMDDPKEALAHIDRVLVKDYGTQCGKNLLFTWDDGYRALLRCKNCGGYILLQKSEFHGSESDSYYTDFFPVSGAREARLLNETYDGFEIEKSFPKRWMNADGEPFWVEPRDKGTEKGE